LIAENQYKILAIHKILEENFTDEQLRIMLVSSLEAYTDNNYNVIAKKINDFYYMFNK